MTVSPSSVVAPLPLENLIAERLERGERVVLATVVGRTGSAPRQPGARMAVLRDPAVYGSVGGGLVEAEALMAAGPVGREGLARRLAFDMPAGDVSGEMICGGTVDVLVEALEPALAGEFARAAVCRAAGVFGVWLVDLRCPERPLRRFHTEKNDLSPAILERCRLGKAGLLQTEQACPLYVEPLVHDGILLLCGGGHVALSTGELASRTGFIVEVAEDRPEFAGAERFPFARACHVLPMFDDLAQACTIGPEHYVVIVTRGHRHDMKVLEQVLRTSARYIGMIGSRRKRDGVYEALAAQGFVEADFARVHCPVGLDIGAETPEEIAVAIMAELIAARHGKERL